MATVRYAVVSVILAVGAVTQTPDQQNEARQAVRSFYDAFNAHSFENAETFTTEDWNHVNPLGGWARGREAVLTELREAHSTFLRGASVTVEDMTVRFATPDVAVVTVAGRGNSSFTTPDGVRHENPRNVSTFIVVKRNRRWLIMQDQNTLVADRH